MILRLATGKELIPLGIGGFSPAVSAVVLVGVNEGASGIRALISRLFLWRVNLKWYLIALLAPLALELLAVPSHQLLGDAIPSVHFVDWLRMLPPQLPGLAVMLLFLAFLASGEELGWRGYALPKLQARYGSVWASLILGLLWGLWHLPLFWIPGTLQTGLPVPGYVLATVGYTFIYTCIHNGSKGSILLACLYHAGSNLALLYWDAIFPTVISKLYLSLPALVILVLLVIAISGPGILTKRDPIPKDNVTNPDSR